MLKIFNKRIGWIHAFLFILMVFLISYHKLFAGALIFKWDASSQFAPYFSLIGDYLRAGKLLLWNPWVNGGSPDFIESQFGAFSPVVLIMSGITGGSGQGFIAYWLLIWLLGGIGMLFLARHLGAPVWGGFVVALGYILSGVFTGHAEHISHLSSMSFLPFVIWRLDLALLNGSRRAACEAGAFLGISSLAGYPGLTILTFCFALVWTTGRWLFTPEKNGIDIYETGRPSGDTVNTCSLRHVIICYALFVVVTLLIISPTYAGFFVEGAGYSDRAQPLLKSIAIRENALHPGALSTIVSPYLAKLKLLNPKQYWRYTDPSSCSIYCGTLVFVLYLAALIFQPRKKWRWLLFGTGIFFLTASLGRSLPVRGWLYDLFFPFRFFRHPSIFRNYFLFSGSVLALYATKDLSLSVLKNDNGFRKKLFMGSLLLAIIAAAVFVSVTHSAQRQSGLTFGIVHFFVVWAGICFAFYMLSKRSGDARNRIVFILFMSIAFFDGAFTAHISKLLIYGNSQTEKELDYCFSHRVASVDLLKNGQPRKLTIRGNMGILLKVPTFRNELPLMSQYHLMSTYNSVTASMSTGDKRVWFSERAANVDPDKRNFTFFLLTCKSLKEPVLVVHPYETMKSLYKGNNKPRSNRSDLFNIQQLRPARQLDIDLLVYEPHKLEFNVICPKQGWLLVTDRWAPGWKVKVNGKPEKLWGGNYIFRAIPVLEGENRIKFTYDPFGVTALVVISYLTLFMILGSGVFNMIKSRMLRKPRTYRYE